MDSRDGQVYPTTQIGNQTWMAANLNYSGDNGAGSRMYTKGWCWGVGGTDTTQHQDSVTCGIQGRLYNWKTVEQGLCPTGWRTPSSSDWKTLLTTVRQEQNVGEGVEGRYLKDSVPGIAQWDSPSFNAFDPYGFSVRPQGKRYKQSSWYNMNNYADFWTSEAATDSTALSFYLSDNNSTLVFHDADQSYGFSLRCIKGLSDIVTSVDSVKSSTVAISSSSSLTELLSSSSSSSSLTELFSSSSASIVDLSLLVDSRDGQIYPKAKIGTQTWMASNLNYSGDNGQGARKYELGWCYGVGGRDTLQHQDSSTCGIHGRLYDWNTAMNVGISVHSNQGLCPANWHVPSVQDWELLLATIRSESIVIAGQEGKYLKDSVDASIDWNLAAYNAFNPYDFSALPQGKRFGDGSWYNLNNYADFWTSDTNASASGAAWDYYLSNNNSSLVKISASNGMGFSLRCIQD